MMVEKLTAGLKLDTRRLVKTIAIKAQDQDASAEEVAEGLGVDAETLAKLVTGNADDSAYLGVIRRLAEIATDGEEEDEASETATKSVAGDDDEDGLVPRDAVGRSLEKDFSGHAEGSVPERVDDLFGRRTNKIDYLGEGR